MTEKHNWISDDLCLIEETTGVKLYGTVCTDLKFIAKQLNDNNNTIRRLEKENKELKSDIKDCAKRYRELFNKYIKLQKENKETEYKPSYPKRNPITYNAVPEAIYNWDD